MDFAPILEYAKANPLLLIVVVAAFLFKDQIRTLFAKFLPKPPVVPPAPVDPNLPPAPAPQPDNQLIEILAKLLPVILPLLLKQVQDAEKKDAESGK